MCIEDVQGGVDVRRRVCVRVCVKMVCVCVCV